MKNILKILSFLILGLFLFIPANVSAASESHVSNANQSTLKNQSYTVLNSTSSLKQKAPPSSSEPVRLSKFKKNILQNDTKSLEVLNPSPDSKISFTSSDTSILTVTQTSDITCEYSGVGYGSAKILVKITKPGFLFFDSKQELEAKINVTPHAISAVFRKSSRNVTVGQSIKLSYTLRPSISKEKPMFNSLRNKIATVNHKGVVKGRRPGTTYIYATLENGKSAKCKITVKRVKASTSS